MSKLLFKKLVLCAKYKTLMHKQNSFGINKNDFDIIIFQI